jgi:RNase P subunit RPR2
MEKVSIICKKCGGRILESNAIGLNYIDLTCLRCGWSVDIPKDTWGNANIANVKDILRKAVKCEHQNTSK